MYAVENPTPIVIRVNCAPEYQIFIDTLGERLIQRCKTMSKYFTMKKPDFATSDCPILNSESRSLFTPRIGKQRGVLRSNSEIEYSETLEFATTEIIENFFSELWDLIEENPEATTMAGIILTIMTAAMFTLKMGCFKRCGRNPMERKKENTRVNTNTIIRAPRTNPLLNEFSRRQRQTRQSRLV
jgi:hypothetical protein